MNKDKRDALESAGFQIGDAADFLGLTEEEQRMVELRSAVSRVVREKRKLQKLTQQQVATRMKSTQGRVAKIESASSEVSLDLMFSGLFAVGGAVSDLGLAARPAPSRRARHPRPARR